MTRTRQILLCAAAATLLAAMSPAAASAARTGIQLSATGSADVRLGDTVQVRARLDGNRLDGRVKASLTIEPADGTQLPVPVRLLDEVVFPGDVVTRHWQVDTGRFVAVPGTWIVRLADAEPLTIEIGPPPRTLPSFVDITEQVGLDDPEWATANPVMCAPQGVGAAWGDIDGDDDLDLYVTRYRGSGVLYRWEGDRFADVTKQAGLSPLGVAETAATFVDVDSDGDQDLHVVAAGGGALWRNDGSGRFRDDGARVGLDLPTAGSSMSWADPDRDGDLDVMVAAYGSCRTSEDELLEDAPRRDTLLLQQEDGTFEDRTELLDLPAKDDGLGFGVLWVDVDDDADLDLLVVNDDLRFIEPRGRHRLWINRLEQGGGLRLVEEGRRRGAGERRNAMGIAAIDHERDGDIDLGISDMGPSQLLRNDGHGRFEDVAVDVGADRGFQDARTPSTTWGLVAVDVDNDADEDLAVPAGALGTTDDYFGGSEPVRSFGRMNLAAPNSNSILLSDDGLRYVEVGAAAGLQRYGLWRGLAVADHDDDGRVDLLFTRLDGPPLFLRNRTRDVGHWVALRLRGAKVRDACGAMVRVEGRALLRACGGVGLASGHDPRVHVGLGEEDGPVDVDVTWTDGARERFVVDSVDRTVELVQGTGTERSDAPATRTTPAVDPDARWPWPWLLFLLVPVAVAGVLVRRRARRRRDVDDAGSGEAPE